MLRVIVLGAAAGGGLPQWNCSCECCRAARRRERGVRPQTQSSIAVSVNGSDWLLLNASPDVRQQLQEQRALHPHPAPGQDRHSPIGAVLLTNGDIDHVAGLLTLREGSPFELYATERVHQTLRHDRVFGVLREDRVKRCGLELDVPLAIDPAARGAGKAAPSGAALDVEIFSVPGKVALYLEDESAGPGLGTRPDDTVAVEIRDPATGRRLLYVPGCAAIDDRLRARLEGADLLLFDGTVYRDAELIERGVAGKTGARMGHLAMAGERGSIALLADVAVERRIFIHINNTNPVWLADSPERKEVRAAGWEIACDGMEITL